MGSQGRLIDTLSRSNCDCLFTYDCFGLERAGFLAV